MTALAFSKRDLAYASDELRGLRDSLRPASVRAAPCLLPFDTVWSADDRLLQVSASVEDLLGWEVGWFIRHQPSYSLYRPQDLERVYAHFYRCLMGRAERAVEHRMLHADGTGYVWLLEDMIPRRRNPSGRVQEVKIRTYDVTPIRAREVDFVLECLRVFDPQRDAAALEELGVPPLLASLLPGAPCHMGGVIIPFPSRVEQDPLSPDGRPALSTTMPGTLGQRRPRRPRRRLPRR